MKNSMAGDEWILSGIEYQMTGAEQQNECESRTWPTYR